MNFGANLTAENQAKIDKAWAEKKRDERLGKTDAPKKDEKKEPPPFKFDRVDAEALKNAKAPSQKDKDNDMKKKTRLIRIYNNYYAHDETAQYLPKPVQLTFAMPVEQIQGHLDGVRACLNSANSAATITKMYPTLVELLIKLLDTSGLLETVGLPGAQGAGLALTAAMNQPMMQTELTEMQIELEDWFSASWHMRLAVKTYMFVKAFSDMQAARNIKATNLSANAAKAMGLGSESKEDE